jgi:hypothetical protein
VLIEAIDLISRATGLSIVTGSPCETLFLGQSHDPDNKNVDQDELWQRLVDAHQKRFLMCAICHNSQLKTEDFHRYGLLNIHAYSLQDLRQIDQDDKRKDRYIKLRNPWGANQRGLSNSEQYRHGLHFSCALVSL